MMISPLRILMLYRQEGLVQTQALYSMEAPWLPKSESGTRSPSLHLRHRGNAFSTKSPPSFSLEDRSHLTIQPVKQDGKVSRGGASAAASASPQQSINHTAAIISQIAAGVSTLMKFFSSFYRKTCPDLFHETREPYDEIVTPISSRIYWTGSSCHNG
jgi:hypothetical protein